MITYQQDNWTWKLQKLMQKAGEWWELQLIRFFENSPDLPTIETSYFSILEQIFKGILLVLAIFLIVWGVIRIVNLMKRYYRFYQQKLSLTVPVEESNLAAQEWLKRSQHFQQQQDYYQACRCLYLAMLHHLHEKQLIFLEKSRTDQEYRYLILGQLPYPFPYETLLNIHQKLCFSAEKATDADLHECQQAYQQLMSLN